MPEIHNECMYYVLDEDGFPIPEPDLTTWARWFQQSEKRIVAQTVIGDVTVSTVFLGADHSFRGGPPVLWETMIFGGEHDEYQQRYHTRAKAIAGHTDAVRMVEHPGQT